LRGPIGTLLEPAGDSGGTAFMFTCPAGEVVIGFEGYANTVGDNLGSIQAVCGSLDLTPSGDALLLTRSSQSELFGAGVNGPVLTATCAQDEVGIGFVPTTNTYVSGFQWVCQQVSHSGGDLRFGASRFVSFGPSMGTEETSRSCSQGEVVSSVFGTSGSSIDSMGLGCSAISTVLCGDGELAPPEECDDGNLTQGDGCDRHCQLE
jgi:cysteine-rich repeat protein